MGNDDDELFNDDDEELDVDDLEQEMRVDRGGRDWNRYCDGKARRFRAREDEVPSLRSSARHAAAKRGLRMVTRFPREDREEINGVTWGKFYLQALPPKPPRRRKAA